MIEEITITSLAGRGSVTMRAGDAKGYWLGAVDWEQAAAGHVTCTAYNQAGASIVSTSLHPRSLSITGWVIDGDVSLRSRCAYLNGFLSPTEDYVLQFERYQIGFRPDASVAYSRERTKNNATLRRFLIQATCPNPFFTETEQTIVRFDTGLKRWRFPTDFGQAEPLMFAVTEQMYNLRVTNPGGFAAGVTITIDFIGNVANPKVRDLKTGRYVGVNHTFAAGDTLTVTTVPGRKAIAVRHADETEENLIRRRDVGMSWLQLEPGANIWAIECGDPLRRPNMQMQIAFTPLHLEVE